MRKQALALIFANGINFLVNFAMNPFLARKLPYEENGTYGQLILICGYLVIFFGLGITSVINLALAENKGKEENIIWSNFWILIMSGVICMSLLFIFSKDIGRIFGNQMLDQYLTLFIPSILFQLLSSFYIYYYIHFNKTHILSLITVLSNTIKIGGMFYLINYLNSFYYTIIFLNIVNCLSFFAHWLGLGKISYKIKLPNLAKISYIIKLGLPYLGVSLVGYSILYANGILVSNMLGVKDFAFYRNGAIEIPFISSLYTSITAVAMPKIVEFVRNDQINELMEIKRNISTVVATLIYPIVIFAIFNGKNFIELYLGDKYLASGIVFSIYNIAVLIRINSYTDILTIKKRPLKIILPNICALLFNILSAWVLINFFGLIGAAIAFSITLLLYSILSVYFSTQEVGVSFWEYFDFKKLGKISLLSIVLSIPSGVLMKPNFFIFIIVSGVYFVLIYYLLICKFSIIDRDLLPTKVSKLLSRLKI